MKRLTLYLHAAAEDDALDCLRSQPQVSGFTLVACQGHSTQRSGGTEERAIDQVVGFVPRIRIEVILQDDQVEEVLTRLRTCLGSGTSQGIWTVSPLLDWGPI
jgi:nitrogen regulatory protein P-II 1